MQGRTISLLRESGLRVTSVRESVLDLFLSSPETALCNSDIEKYFNRLDRSTLYRTLKTLEDKGIIHQVFDNSGKSKYAANAERVGEKVLEDVNHCHFHCVECEKTICLTDTNLPVVKVPAGFKVNEKHMLLSGTCEQCVA